MFIEFFLLWLPQGRELEEWSRPIEDMLEAFLGGRNKRMGFETSYLSSTRGFKREVSPEKSSSHESWLLPDFSVYGRTKKAFRFVG